MGSSTQHSSEIPSVERDRYGRDPFQENMAGLAEIVAIGLPRYARDFRKVLALLQFNQHQAGHFFQGLKDPLALKGDCLKRRFFLLAEFAL
jgi:hypothetical protein